MTDGVENVTDNLEQYVGKKVTVVKKLAEPNADGHTAVEVEGTVILGNTLGLLLKPRGRTMDELIEAKDIEDIHVTPTTPKVIKQKTLKPVTEDNVRQHLADRHGYLLSSVNGMTDELALETHEAVDHSDLAHNHEKDEDEVESGSDDDGDDD